MGDSSVGSFLLLCFYCLSRIQNLILEAIVVRVGKYNWFAMAKNQA